MVLSLVSPFTMIPNVPLGYSLVLCAMPVVAALLLLYSFAERSKRLEVTIMTSETNTRWSIGKLIVSLIAIFTAVSPYLADWNETHIYNPLWLPHAKFHNAQTMVLGALLGLLSIYCLWFRREISNKQKLNEAAVLASLYWLAQLPAIFFPGTALTDPGINRVQMLIVIG